LVPPKAKAHGRLAVHDERFPASVLYFPNHFDSSGKKIPEKQGFSMPVDKKMLEFQGNCGWRVARCLLHVVGVGA